MANEKVIKLLDRLRSELQQTDSADTATLDLLKSLETSINQRQELQAGADQYEAPVVPEYQDKPFVEQLEELEVSFATKHPLIEQTLREIINTLGKMGI